jgi:hypothetical protein
MGEMMQKIEQGQIWIVKSDSFMTSSKGGSNKYKRPIVLTKNELIEIRYPYAWHFRTLDNHYLHAEPDDILKNCELFATIWDNVRFGNKCNLNEIVNSSLCDFVKENSYVWAHNFNYKYLKDNGLMRLISSFQDNHKKPEL